MFYEHFLFYILEIQLYILAIINLSDFLFIFITLKSICSSVLDCVFHSFYTSIIYKFCIHIIDFTRLQNSELYLENIYIQTWGVWRHPLYYIEGLLVVLVSELTHCAPILVPADTRVDENILRVIFISMNMAPRCFNIRFAVKTFHFSRLVKSRKEIKKFREK